MISTFENIVDMVAEMPRNARRLWQDRRLEADDVAHTRARVERCWCIWPPGVQKKKLSGLRILAGQPFSEWPMARGKGDIGGNVGSSAGTAIPTAFFLGTIVPIQADKGRHSVRESWAERRSGLEPLHTLLGGEASSLDAVEAVLFDDEQPFLAGVVMKDVDRRPHINRLLRLLDPSPEHIRFRDFLEAQFETDDALPVPDVGVWEPFAVAKAFGRGFVQVGGVYSSHRELETLTCDLAWRLLHLPPQCDVGYLPYDADHAGHAGNILTPDALASAMVAVTLASPVRLEQWSSSPLYQAVLLPAAKDSRSDWHHGYMEAAAGYDGLDQPEIAWNLLCAGSFWVNRRGGNWRAYFDAALALSQRRGWTDCAAALTNMAERAQLD